MITKINKIKKCGIFRNFVWNNTLKEFGKYNLIYGLNGSGKSTLSQALSYFANQSIAFEDAEIVITENGSKTVDNKDQNNQFTNPLYIFNKDFVQKNIDTDGKLDEIVYLSEENIEAKNSLKQLQQERDKLDAQKSITIKNFQETKRIYEDILSDIACKIKEYMIDLGGKAATSFQNYNKRNASNFYSSTIKPISDLLIDETKIPPLSIAVKESVLPKIDISFKYFSESNFEMIIEDVLKTLQHCVSKVTVNNYSKDILDWIEEGLKYVQKDTYCPFCSAPISEDRLTAIKGLFDKEYTIFQQELTSLIDSIEQLKMDVLTFETNTYDEYASEISSAINTANKCIKEINVYLDRVKSTLNDKRTSYNSAMTLNYELDKTFISKYNDQIDILNKLITACNDKTDNFEKKQKDELDELATILLLKYFKESQYENRLEEYKNSTLVDKDIESKIKINKENIAIIENQIRDVIVAADKFNGLLHQFLGRDEISLKYEDSFKAYKLIRAEDNTKAERLSEGEKTAIAFVYFLTKIRENGNLIENTIVKSSAR